MHFGLKDEVMCGGGDDRQHTQRPTVWGSSVIAIKYRDGVMMVGDTLGSYGHLARYTNIQRFAKITDDTLIGGAGEISDFQHVAKTLKELSVEDFCYDDGITMSPKEVFSYLSHMMYRRRSKFDPLYNQFVVGGFRDGEAFLGYTDLQGTAFEENFVCSGLGLHLSMPIIRNGWRADLTKAEAEELLKTCLSVLFYRDSSTINRFQISSVTANGVDISEPFSLDTKWKYKMFETHMDSIYIQPHTMG